MTDDEPRSVFSKYLGDEPEKESPPVTVPRGPLLQPVVPPTDHNSPPVERLLDFLVNRWRKPEIRLNEIRQFGPWPIRDRKSALALAEVLVAHGWLKPVKAWRYDIKMWTVVRGPTHHPG